MKIMIVDDHSDMRRILRSIVFIAFKGRVEFIECESGNDALEQYRAYQPDIVLMDLQLDKMDGFEVTEQLYHLDPQAKVVIVTSYDSPLFRQKAKDLNTVGFICKDKLSDLKPLLQKFTS